VREALKEALKEANTLRFSFGRNWRNFLGALDEDRIRIAEASLREALNVGNLAGQAFLDIGSGSGLFSLAARRLGATVRSFDYDFDSVECTRELKQCYFSEDDCWCIEQASILDREYVSHLGTFNIVYSWGVLHHTGAMWTALENAAGLVRPGGRLFISIYNDQGWQSRVWRAIKRLYNVSPRAARLPLVLAIGLLLQSYSFAAMLIRERNALPFRRWKEHRKNRGMSTWYDLVDWVGGYPFEVATPERVTDFLAVRGFRRLHTKLTRGLGCNEFVFLRQA
jgi:2-polyprenyl-3-methyl-5-hydroxy-6-metoxy-1,4-benzoquinol methylase